MQGIETERLECALTCVSMLAQGRHPVSGAALENEILDDPHVIRSLNYAEHVLKMCLHDGTRLGAEADPGSWDLITATGRGGSSNPSDRYGRDMNIENLSRQDAFSAGLMQAGGEPEYQVDSQIPDSSLRLEPDYRGDDQIPDSSLRPEPEYRGDGQFPNSSLRLEPEYQVDSQIPGSGLRQEPDYRGDGQIPNSSQRPEPEKDVKSRKVPFPYEVLSEFSYEQDKSIVHVLKQFAEPLGDLNVRMPSGAVINRWFGKNGYLAKEPLEPGGKEFWMPTEKGYELGLYPREGIFKGEKIVSVMFDKNAQNFLAENLALIMADKN